MKITRREGVLGFVVLMCGLYAGLFYLGRGLFEDWKTLQAEKEQLRDAILRSEVLVESRSQWEAKMQELQSLMPQFPKDKRMDVHWLGEMEKKAAARELAIVRHEVGKELQEGPIYELPLYCRRWEGSLEALVYFLFDLEGEGAMLDVRYLHVKPKDKMTLDGRFDLYCAYRKEGS